MVLHDVWQSAGWTTRAARNAPSRRCRCASTASRQPPQRHHLAAVDHDGGAGDEAAGVGDEQQQRAVEIALLAEAADRNLALDGGALLAQRDSRG